MWINRFDLDSYEYEIHWYLLIIRGVYMIFGGDVKFNPKAKFKTIESLIIYIIISWSLLLIGLIFYQRNELGNGVVLLFLWLVGVGGILLARRIIIKKERTHQRHERVWQATFNSITDFVSIHDNDNNILLANKALADFLGVSPESLIGKKCYEEIHFSKHLHPECPKRDALGNQFISKTFYDEHQGLWIEVSVAPILNQDNQTESFVHVIRDVTEVHLAHTAAKESARHYKMLFDKAPVAYQSIGTQGVIVEVNEAWLNLFGYSKSEIVGKEFKNFVVEKHKERASNLNPELHSITDVFVTELSMVNKIGEELAIEISGKVTRNLDDNSKHLHCIFNNVSQVREHEMLFARYNEQLERQVKESTEEVKIVYKQLLQKEKLATIGKLSGSVAHDIRNPLGAISNSVFYLEMKNKDQGDEKILRHISIMKDEVKRVSSILNNLDELSFNEKQDLQLADINILISTVLSSTMVPDKIDVETNLDTSIPRIYFDVTQLRRVFDNILANAIESIQSDGRVEITTFLKDTLIEIEIKDNGVGIEPEHLNRLFDPLFSTKKKGVGFGLAVTKSYVEAHRGQMIVQSEPGKGSSFSILLPTVIDNFEPKAKD